MMGGAGKGRKGCDLSLQGRDFDFCFPFEIIAGEEERVEDRSSGAVTEVRVGKEARLKAIWN